MNKKTVSNKRPVSNKKPILNEKSVSKKIPISNKKTKDFGKTSFDNPVKTDEKCDKQTGKQSDMPVCSVYKKCGGCQYQDKTYQWQLKEKEKQVAKLLQPFVSIKPIIGMKNPYYYRNKVHAVFDRDRRGNIISGVYQAGTHQVVPVDSCLIEDQQCDAIIVTIRSMLKSFKIKTYDEDSGYGLFRHALIRKGFSTGEIMVILVTASPVFPSRNNFVKALLKAHPEITTIVQNVNNRGDSMVLGKTDKTLYGKGYIEDRLCGCVFRISPQSFYQVNPVQTEILYNKTMEYAGLTGKESVIDAYCGTGTIGLIASKHAKSVIGIELNKDAVRDAISNAKRNDVKNTRFFSGDATQFMVDMAENGEKADVVFLDPPRSGSTRQCLDAVVKIQPGRVVYVSCNPETLARDLAYITKKGYRVREAVPVDCFPWTGHVETVVLLSRKTPDDTIEVDLDLDELDITSAESKATYQEIKDYVLKEYGLKVSTLYISQIKRKCGIDVGEH